MQFLGTLWIPVLVATLATWLYSVLAWTVLPNHKREYLGLPNDDAVMDVLRAAGVPPGRYSVPWAADGKDAARPEIQAKMARGPIAFITIAPPGMPHMGRLMLLSVLTCLVVAIFTAYLAFHALAPGAEYRAVFRIAGTATFMAYGLGIIPEAVWFARPARSTAVHLLDSGIQGLLAGGVFGWLWP